MVQLYYNHSGDMVISNRLHTQSIRFNLCPVLSVGDVNSGMAGAIDRFSANLVVVDSDDSERTCCHGHTLLDYQIKLQRSNKDR